jgi:restriction system protein
MALWLVRAGSSGEYESKFLTEGKIYLTWDDLSDDLSKIANKKELYELLNTVYPNNKSRRIRNWASQIWPMAKEMKIGDWIMLPSKKKAAIHIGEITGEYINTPEAENPYYHYRTVNWFATDIPRSNFDQDILYSLGAFMTICRISRNDAEKRIKEMAKNNWKIYKVNSAATNDKEENSEEPTTFDLEQLARDQIAKFMIRKFKGHGLARLVDAILQAQGYSTFVSPEGPDKGVDILAAPGPLGFGSPRLCVQVKSGDSPLDRPTLDQLIGVMQNFGAEQGLLVSWGGFKSSVDKEIPNQFFRVRLWDQNSIINELLQHYDSLDEDIKAEIPLKRMWALAISEDE